MKVVLVALACIAACNGKPKATKDPKSCRSNEECSPGWVCLAYECADPRAKAIYTAPSNAVTPDKVRRQLEETQKQREAKTDQVLGGAQ
jgi:hypothetical protein